MKKELTERRLYSFAQKIDAQYKDRFGVVYSSFALMKDFVIPRAMISKMYEDFKESFPHVHSIMAIIVSSSRHCIELANGFSDPSIDVPDEVVSSEDEQDSEDANNGTNEEDASAIELHRLERAILEYFLSLIRLKSQKQLPYWSMLNPLGYFSLKE